MRKRRMERVALTLLFVVCLAVVVFGVAIGGPKDGAGFKSVYNKTAELTASVFFKDSVTEASLKKIYAKAEKSGHRKRGEKVKVLIVPGHDVQFPGTAFNGLKELELNLALGGKLFNLLRTEPSLDVHLSQTKSGYNPQLLAFFENKRQPIFEFIERQKGEMEKFVRAGEVKRVVSIKHNSAPSEMAFRLFSINKWANENGMDVVIHIHFNDYPGRRKDREEKFSGFSIYVPESQYSNAKGSKSVAKSINDRLAKLYPQSNLPVEDDGVVEDQELIAIGANNTLDGAGMLIEYGYIYEPIFSNPDLRDTALSDLAMQTFLGIMDFFEETKNDSNENDSNSNDVNEKQTSYVPHNWQENLKKGNKADLDVLHLQAALVLDGVYPPAGEIKNDCALTGYFGPCTEKAVKVFQEKYEISPAEGFVGEKTRAKLNELFGDSGSDGEENPAVDEEKLVIEGGKTIADAEKPITAVEIGGETVQVELAVTPAERAQGLSGRKSLAAGNGMFFVFETSGIYNFWMADMFFPIDIIWIDEQKKIVHIESNVLPESFPTTFSSSEPAKYVLEVPAGFSDKTGLSVGDPVLF